MGQKDVCEKSLFSDNQYFADLVNMMVFHGKQVVAPDSLSELDSTELLGDIINRFPVSVQKFRDVMNHDQDHVHVLFRGQPNSEISKFINAYKSASSRLVKKDFPEIRQYLWKEMFWSKSYCLLTTGDAPVDIIRQYIQTQSEDAPDRRRKYGKPCN